MNSQDSKSTCSSNSNLKKRVCDFEIIQTPSWKKDGENVKEGLSFPFPSVLRIMMKRRITGFNPDCNAPNALSSTRTLWNNVRKKITWVSWRRGDIHPRELSKNIKEAEGYIIVHEKHNALHESSSLSALLRNWNKICVSLSQ